MCSQPVYESCTVIPWKSPIMCLSVSLERDVSTDIRQPVLPCTVTTTPFFFPRGHHSSSQWRTSSFTSLSRTAS